MFSSLKKKIVALSVVVAAALAATGCIKSDEKITVYPDGSGKVESKSTLSGPLAQMAKMGQLGGPNGMGGGEGQPGAKPDPFEMIKKGWGDSVYWTNLKAEDGPQGEWCISGTGYFEDANKVKREKGSMSFKKTEAGDGYVFSMESSAGDEFSGKLGGDDPNMPPEQKQQQEAQKQMFKTMLTGFDMKVSVVMPGAVKTAEGMTPGEGRKAVFAMGEKELAEIIDGKRQPPKSMTVTSGAADPAVDAELATFKTELAKAKEAAAAEKAKGGAAPKKDEKKTEGGAEKKPAPEGEKKDGQKKQDF